MRVCYIKSRTAKRQQLLRNSLSAPSSSWPAAVLLGDEGPELCPEEAFLGLTAENSSVFWCAYREIAQCIFKHPEMDFLVS